MQYNLAHSNYNSAKFNWIVYRRRSLAARYRNKRLPKPPRPNPLHSSSFFSFASSFLPSFLPRSPLCRLLSKNKREFHRLSSSMRSPPPLKLAQERRRRHSCILYFSPRPTAGLLRIRKRFYHFAIKQLESSVHSSRSREVFPSVFVPSEAQL